MIVILVLWWPSAGHGIVSLVWVHLRVCQLTEQQRLRGCIQVVGIHAGCMRIEAVHGIHDLECSRRVGLAGEAWVEGVDGSWWVLRRLMGR